MLREEPRRLYRHDMWAGAYLIGGGCSDDGFISFRARLIAQGRDWYKKASPDSLPTIPPWQGGGQPATEIVSAPLWYFWRD